MYDLLILNPFLFPSPLGGLREPSTLSVYSIFSVSDTPPFKWEKRKEERLLG